jgi:hypothetical protein
VIEHQAILQLTELSWDGKTLFMAEKDITKPHIWSSATLYDAQVRATRERWFAELLDTSVNIDAKLLLDFHQYGGNGDIQNDMRMNRNNTLMTQCIMQVVKDANDVQYQYIDFL